MTSAKRVWVIDASVIVSAVLSPEGSCRRALLAARRTGVIAQSVPTIAEIEAVLSRPRFARAATKAAMAHVQSLLRDRTLWVEPTQPVHDCRDPKANIYLELAHEAGAEAIVSGDADLTSLDPWRGIRVMTVARFLAHVALDLRNLRD